MAVQTTFNMFQQLLRNAVNNDTTLEATLKAALLLRLDYLPRLERNILGSAEVNAIVGGTVDEATDSITFLSGSSGTIDFDLITYGTPVRIDGTIATLGLLTGHVGQGTNSAIPEADITFQYRESDTGTWKAFNRTTVLDNITTVQFRAVIATLGADGDMPQVHVLAEQE